MGLKGAEFASHSPTLISRKALSFLSTVTSTSSPWKLNEIEKSNILKKQLTKKLNHTKNLKKYTIKSW